MSDGGFILTGLRVGGRGVPPAQVEFSRGLNVVSGASNTGKTYVAECIDFMLGGETKPRAIAEAKGYTEVFLGLRPESGSEFSLRRSIGGGHFQVIEADFDAAASTPAKSYLGAEHAGGKKNTVSAHLLGLCGLQDKFALANQSGTTQRVSFRNIVHLVFVHEREILKRSALFRSGQWTQPTFEAAVFRLLLTGIGADGKTRNRTTGEERARNVARAELLDEFVEQSREELGRLNAPDDPGTELDALRRRLEEQLDAESIAREHVAGLGERQQASLRVRDEAAVRLRGIDGLVQRFELLRQQYRADLERLSALAEAQYFLQGLPARACVLCGAESPRGPAGEQIVPDVAFREAAASEVKKIAARLAELDSAVRDLQSEHEAVTATLAAATNDVAQLRRQLEDVVGPRLRAVADQLGGLYARRAQLERAVQLKAQLASLELLREDGHAPIKPGAPAPDLRAAELSDLCAEMSEMLAAWKLPGDVAVTFDESTQDFVVGETPRINFGKGIAAIIYAAFCVSLLLHNRRRGLPHPGFVILDSPLVTYGKRDVRRDEAIPDSVPDAFYTDLASRAAGAQVIVFENNPPPAALTGQIRHTRFTGTWGYERQGFFERGP